MPRRGRHGKAQIKGKGDFQTQDSTRSTPSLQILKNVPIQKFTILYIHSPPSKITSHSKARTCCQKFMVTSEHHNCAHLPRLTTLLRLLQRISNFNQNLRIYDDDPISTQLTCNKRRRPDAGGGWKRMGTAKGVKNKNNQTMGGGKGGEGKAKEG